MMNSLMSGLTNSSQLIPFPGGNRTSRDEEIHF